MTDTNTQSATDYSVRVRCSPEIYRKFKGVFTMAGMTQKDALDEAFKNFAEAMLRDMRKDEDAS